MGLAVPASAVGIDPSVEIWVDGGLVASFDCSDTQFDCTGPEDEFSVSLSTSDYEITLAALFDPDASMVYAGNVFDKGAGNAFNIVFRQGIVSTEAPGGVSHDQSGSFTDGGNGSLPVGFVSPLPGISQDAALDEIFLFSVSTNSGASWLNAGLDLVEDFTGIPTAGSSGVQPAEDEAGFGPAGAGSFYDAMRIDVNFSLEGSNDRYTWNGTAEVIPESEVIPEPGTAALLGLGLAGLGAARRRRAR